MEHLNRAMDHIEDHLDGTVDVSELARIALTSEYHLRRTFSALAGVPLSEYVRRRRLTVAGAEVLAGDRTLLDIAVRYGYGSGEAFARAFRALHGIGPGEARRTGAALQAQPRMSFRLVVEGSSTMQYRIVERDGFRVVGRSARVPLVHEGINPGIAEMIRSIGPGTMARIAALSDQEPSGVISATVLHDPNRAEGSDVDYYHGVVSGAAADALPDDLDVLSLPPGTWAVFANSGEFPQALQELWRDVFTQWFPSNPYRYRPGPELLKVGAAPDGGGAAAELWIPVEKAG